jgi:hypothetical protein
MKNHSLGRQQHIAGARLEWKAFQGLVHVLATTQLPSHLLEKAKAAILRCAQIEISRKEIAQKLGERLNRTDIDVLLALLVREGFISPIADEPFHFQPLAEPAVANPDSNQALGDERRQLRLPLDTG